jgi:transmembrane sensor
LDELIIQVLNGDAPPDAAERVRRWRADSEENELRYREMSQVWSLTEPVAPSIAESPVDVSVILKAAEERRDDEGRRVEHRPAEGGDDTAVVPLSRARPRVGLGSGTLRWGLALAAGVAAVALGIRIGTLAPEPDPLASYLAPDGSPSLLTLDDGTFVKLAAGSALDVLESEGERRVRLSGRAFFAVARETGRPFVVQSGAAQTRVLGTRFEVSETEREVRTIVLEGRVAVSNDQGSVNVPSGSLARAVEGLAPTSETPDDVYALLDWPGGLMLFQDTPLSQVALEVERRFGSEVRVEGVDLRALRISGTFEDQDFEDVVLALCETTGARCELTADGVSIER